MTKVLCDYCGNEVNISKLVVADIDKDNMVYIKILPDKLVRTDLPVMYSPDICAYCIIKAIKERH